MSQRCSHESEEEQDIGIGHFRKVSNHTLQSLGKFPWQEVGSLMMPDRCEHIRFVIEL